MTFVTSTLLTWKC